MTTSITALAAASALTGTEVLPVDQGGTTVKTTPNAIVALAGASLQPLDSDLTAIAALTTTTYGRALLALADAAAARTALGLGTAATTASSAYDAAGAAAAAAAASQPLDSDLTAIAALTTTSFGRAFLALADAAAGRTALGLGSIATQAASTVAITGGTVAGITDLAVADGGTGASTAANARTNLGLGGAAILNVGATAGTVAAGDDSRFSGGGITVQDEGSSLATAATTLNFAGAGVVASGTGSTKTITVSGGGGGGTAAGTTFTPAGGLASTDVQAALQELDTEKVAIADAAAASDAVPLPNAATGAPGTSPLYAREGHVHPEAPVPSNTQTASYVLVLSDAYKCIEMNVAGANTLTIPPNSSVAFPVGTIIEVFQLGAGQTTITPGSGVTLRSNGAKLRTTAQYASVALRKRATDEWAVAGDLSA